MPKRDSTKRDYLPKDRGDVEQTIAIEADLAEEARLPNIRIRESKDARPRLNYLEMRVNPPHPTELPFKITARCWNDFSSSPVVIRAKIFLDDTEIGSFTGVVGKSPLARTFAQTTVDVLKGKATHPNSMLLMVRAEALLMPIGTDIDTIDPATATTTSERMTTILGNPVRINFAESADGPALPLEGGAAPISQSRESPAPSNPPPSPAPTAPPAPSVDAPPTDPGPLDGSADPTHAAGPAK